MVTHAESVYLFLGDDEAEKQKQINSIKAQHLDADTAALDFEVIHGDDTGLSPADLNETLSYAPSLSKKKIILIRKLASLNKANRDALLAYARNPSPAVMVLLDGAGMGSDDPFIAALSGSVKTIRLKPAARKNDAFDLCRAILAHNPTTAIRILKVLLNNREKPQNILGALIWQWERAREELSLEQFKKGLQLLLYTDHKIKTGRLEEGLALEMLVIRLAYLLV